MVINLHKLAQQKEQKKKNKHTSVHLFASVYNSVQLVVGVPSYVLSSYCDNTYKLRTIIVIHVF